MKLNFKVVMNGKEKPVYQNIYTGEMYVKDAGEKLSCKWLNDEFMEISFYGNAIVK